MRENKLKRARFEFNFYPDEAFEEYDPISLSFELPHDCTVADINHYYRAFLAAMGYPEPEQEQG